MSETKLATKADLKEMYDRMLPYMGGMPEMLANKFSKGDLYSTDEKMIGQWIDGKPLYAKTFDIGALPNNSYKSVSTGLTNENVKIIKGVATASWGAINLPHVTKESVYNVELSYEGHSIKVVTGTDRSSMEGSVTIYYTKTTDSAISIGNDTDYSTDEKIVGTWIDSKPIWQKTLQLRPTKNYPANTVTYDTLYTDESVDKLISMKGTLTFTYGDYLTNVLPHSSTIYQQYNFIPVWNQNQNALVMNVGLQGGSHYTPSELLFVITLQYTKTTS